MKIVALIFFFLGSCGMCEPLEKKIAYKGRVDTEAENVDLSIAGESVVIEIGGKHVWTLEPGFIPGNLAVSDDGSLVVVIVNKLMSFNDEYFHSMLALQKDGEGWVMRELVSMKASALKKKDGRRRDVVIVDGDSLERYPRLVLNVDTNETADEHSKVKSSWYNWDVEKGKRLRGADRPRAADARWKGKVRSE